MFWRWWRNKVLVLGYRRKKTTQTLSGMSSKQDLLTLLMFFRKKNTCQTISLTYIHKCDTWSHYQCCILESLGILGLTAYTLVQVIQLALMKARLMSKWHSTELLISSFQPELHKCFLSSFYVVLDDSYECFSNTQSTIHKSLITNL